MTKEREMENDPYRSSPRLDAQRLVDTSPVARALRDTIANVYLSSELTVAEIRAIVTLGLEYGMARETRSIFIDREGNLRPHPKL